MPLRPGPHNASISARAAEWIVCAEKGSGRSPRKTWKNGQGMTGEGLGDIMDGGGWSERFFVSEHS